MGNEPSAARASDTTSSDFTTMAQALGRAVDEGVLADGGLERLAAERAVQREQVIARQLEGEQARRAYFAALAAGEEPGREQAPAPPSDGLPGCATCRGCRFLRPAVPPDDPRFGKLVRCPACLAAPETGRELRGRAGRAAGLKEGQLGNTFGTFKPAPASLRAFRAVRAWAELPKGWLTIHGEPGCGKSHLAAAAVNHLLEQGREVRYWYTPDLMDEVKHTIDQGGDAHHWLLRSLKEQPILVLDDLGAGARTEYAVETLEKLLDYRYREFLPTLIMLIGSPEQVKEHLSESIGRRMQDPRIGQVIKNDAPQWGAPESGNRD